LWPVVAAAVVLAAAGGLAGREFYRPKPVEHVSSPSAGSSEPSTSVPAAAQPGSPKVTATQDVADHPQFSGIGPMLQDHFDSINAKDYGKWRSTVTKQRASTYAETAWKVDYKSTQDGSILVHRIDSAPDRRLRVLVAFTSVQDIADAPLELPVPCIRWHIVLPLTREDNKWKIDAGPEGASPRHDECGAQTS
jgi:hypothetical protein